MANSKSTVMFTYLLQSLALSSGLTTSSQYSKCKPIPSESNWPSDVSWQALKFSLSGRLLSPAPPGAVCHPTQPTFDALRCPIVLAEWHQNAFHAADPISNNIQNWNNDSCLPVPTYSCSGAGFPVYVVNATSAKDVKKGVDFARKTGVRLNVKGTGHDYLGRSQASNSLSIWTRHIIGIEHYPAGTFIPKACSKSKKSATAALSIGAGVPMEEINSFAASLNLTAVSGGAATVGLGGYISGGGHGAISPIYGLAADNVLEIDLVTPSGDIITANECQNTDLFWAYRGGGGATFGVATSFTIRAFPSFRYATAQVLLATPSPNVDQFYTALAQYYSLVPALADKGISMYSSTGTGLNVTEYGIPFTVNGLEATFNLPLLYPENTTASLVSELESILATTKNAGGGVTGTLWISSVTPFESNDFYTWWKIHNGPQNGGDETILASRLLTKKSLTTNLTSLKTALEGASATGGITAHMISGPAVHAAANIPGGSNSVNNAFRDDAYLHVITGVSFPPLNPAERRRQHDLLTNVYSKPLRDLQPEGGAYVNEANPEEPSYQKAFWGRNYERLARIKQKVDPEGVFWCAACVKGDEWAEKVGKDGKTRVCRV